MNKKKLRNTVFTVIIWIAIWQGLAGFIKNSVFLPSPFDVIKSFAALMVSYDFLQAVGFSLGNIAKGFLLGILAGTTLAFFASLSEAVSVFLSLPMRVIQATPVASFTILALLWINSQKLSILISFLMVLPLIYTNVLTGIRETDRALLEMAKVFHVRKFLQIRYIYLPSALPYLFSACTVAIGLAWKSGIAAEVIGITKNSIGNHLYQSKIYLEIPELFAWTMLTVGISILFEKAVLYLLRLFEEFALGCSRTPTQEAACKTSTEEPVKTRMEEQGRAPAKEPVKTRMEEQGRAPAKEPVKTEAGILFSNITKGYGKQPVISGGSFLLEKGRPVAIMGKSGIGKTTLLRLALGIEQPDAGEIVRGSNARQMAVVFQENRLCEATSVRRNLELVCRTKNQRESIPGLLYRLGLAEAEEKRVSKLSGGMKRRVAIGRALLKDAPVLLLDEPFQGLDESTKLEVMQLVKEKMKQKTVLLVTHEKAEAEYLGCQIFELEGDESSKETVT